MAQVPTPEQSFAEILEEAARDAAFESEMSLNPYAPGAKAVAMAALHAESCVPFLLSRLGAGASEREWALRVLEALGPRASGAAPALAEEVRSGRGGGFTLYVVDEALARSLGVHLAPPTRERIAQALWSAGRLESLGAFLTEALGDPAAVASVLGPAVRELYVRDLAERRPSALPVAAIRAALGHPNRQVRAQAARVLDALRRPEDATAVLAWVERDGGEPWPGLVEWLAPLAGSERLLPTLLQRQEWGSTFELVRRRRCALLTTDPAALRPAVREVLRSGNAVRRGYALRLVAETRDGELLEDLLATLSPSDDLALMLRALAALVSPRPVHELLERAQGSAVGERALAIRYLRDHLARRPDPTAGSTLETADGLFLAGRWEDTLVDTAAYDGYAVALSGDPRSVRAAHQLAFIDRAFGVPIEAGRLAGLRALGVAEELLAELAGPPPSTLSGFRFHWTRPGPHPEELQARAEQAEGAGAFAVAASLWAQAGRGPEAARARDAAQRQLERVRRLAG